jgi:hypothetical protein
MTCGVLADDRMGPTIKKSKRILVDDDISEIAKDFVSCAERG